MAPYSQETIEQARAFDNAAAPEKMRVHALAKALGIQSKDVIRELDAAGIPNKRAQSAVSADDRAKVIAAVTAGAESTAEEGAKNSTAGDKKPAQKKTAKKAANKQAKKQANKAPVKSAEKTEKKSAGKTSKTTEANADEAPAEAAETAVSAEASAEEKAAEPTKAVRKTAKKTTRRRSGAKNTQQSAQNPEAEETPASESAAESTNAQSTTADNDEPEVKKAAPKRRRRVTAQSAPKTEAPAAPSVDAPSEEDSHVEAQTEAEVLDAVVSEPRPPQVRTRRRTRRTVRRTTTSADGSTQSVQGSQELFSESNEDGSHSESETAEIVETTVDAPIFQAPKSVENNRASNRGGGKSRNDRSENDVIDQVIDVEPTEVTVTKDDRSETDGDENNRPQRSRRRRRGRGRGRSSENQATPQASQQQSNEPQSSEAQTHEPQVTSREEEVVDRGEGDVVKQTEEPIAIKGSTRLEAQRRRRADRREQSKKRHVISEAEFLARRESVERTMVVRDRQRHDHSGTVTQVGVLEDNLLVEHMVTSETEESQIGNIYLGRVQNVLPSMEAAFIDIGHDRNGVLYSADVNWRALGPEGKSRRIERFLKSGDQVLVQVSKDPIGHKGPRLTTQISFAGRFLVYVPDGQSAGISRKLPEPERKRLKRILKEVTPEGAGTIVRTAAEGVDQEAIAGDIARLEKQWNDISARAEEAKARKGAKPLALYEEPDLLLKVVRDIFNEDFSSLIVQGGDSWRTVKGYVDEVAPDLADRVHRYLPRDHGGVDVFDEYRIEEQIEKALDRKVWLPSGGSLIIDRTEAMTVIDVNTGKFTGSGGNLEETVTRNNLEAAEEIVRQMRLRDLGGMIVVDFIDMVLPENQDLVLRRVKEALGRDRTRHEVSEVTSLGLVQMTRKRLGTGLLETFSTECKTCRGTGYLIHEDPVEHEHELPRTKRSPRPHDKDEAPRKNEKTSLPDAHRTPSSATTDQHQDSAESEKRDAQGAPEHNDGQERGQSQSRSSQRRRRRRANQRRAAEAGQQAQSDQRVKSTQGVDDNRASGSGSDSASASGEVWSDDDDYFVTESTAQREEELRADEAVLGVIDSILVTSDDKVEEELDPIAAVVAAATAEAAEKDPDEPSDDRYVPGVSRRRGRRRVVRQDSVQEQEPKQAPKAEQSQGSRKGQTYQEAMEKFEASPRRRRPTRGKSRSDHAPNPADFESEAPATATVSTDKPEGKSEPKPVQKAEPKSEQKVERTVRTSSSSRRRRRRVVRKITTATAQNAEQQQEKAQESQAEAPVKKSGKVAQETSGSGAKVSSRGSSGGNRSGRSRRRVVRKNN